MKNIIVYSGSRADYGIIKTLILKLKKKKINLKLALGAQHNNSKYNNSLLEIIKKDKLKCDHIPNFKINKTLPENIVNYSCKTIQYYNKIFSKKKIDLLVLVGDRYEVFALAFLAHYLGIKICHLHGGEVTEGSYDDSARHAITKLSNFHFVSTDRYKKRVIQLGENPNTVFNIGAPSIENYKDYVSVFKKEFPELSNDKKSIIITFHPETASTLPYKKQIEVFLNALKFSNLKNFNLVFTSTNSDTMGNYFNLKIKKFVKKNKNCFFYKTLGKKKYFTLLENCKFLVGNSSSGIIEAPCFNIYTLNIGTRQKSRLFPNSVISCRLSKSEIVKNVKKILKKTKHNFKNPYFKKNSSSLMIKHIFSILKYNKKIKAKKFYDC